MERIKRLKLSARTHKLSLNINACDVYKKKTQRLFTGYKAQRSDRNIEWHKNKNSGYY